MDSTLKPSSSTDGFFQNPPTILPQYTDDSSFRRILSLHLPPSHPIAPVVSADLLSFSARVLTLEIQRLMASAEAHLPYLQPLTAFGAPSPNPLVTSEGWRRLQDIGIKEGMVALGYEDDKYGEFARLYQFAKYHLWSGSAAMVTCPNAMTDGAARLLGQHLGQEKVFEKARRRLISRETEEGHHKAWTSGQWMTERKGGSDVSGTETVAVYEPEATAGEEDAAGMPLGPWRIDGFKWFSSATDADCTVLLARTSTGKLSAFYAPLMKRIAPEGAIEMNGVRIQRLKNKLGTKALATAELELKGMRAYMLGREGEGIKEISTMLNITRVHNVVSGMGMWARGLAVSRAYARVRRLGGGRLLADVPAHVTGLAEEHVKYAAHTHLSFLVVRLLGRSEQQHWSEPERTRRKSGSTLEENPFNIPEKAEEVDVMLRLLTPLAKAQTALSSIAGLRFCMESLGGVGYLENHEDPLFNIARLFRDTNVLSIWEGTTDVMAEDVVRVVKAGSGRGEKVLKVINGWVRTANTSNGVLGTEKELLKNRWNELEKQLSDAGKEELKWKGREILAKLDGIICGCLLVLDASSDGDEAAVGRARRWVKSKVGETEETQNWEAEAALDRILVFGGDRGIGKAKL